MTTTWMPNHGMIDADIGNAYVPNMTHHPHIQLDGSVTVKWVAPVANDTDYLVLTGTEAGEIFDNLGIVIAEPYGRTLDFTSTDADGTFTVYGRDYLGQQMSQAVTISASNGATLKAFKYVDKLVSTTNVGDIEIRAGTHFGLPFVASEVVRESTDGAAASEGTLVAPVSTDPATTTTGDVRGTYAPGTTADGAKDIQLTYVVTGEKAGGLYGVKQV